MIRSTVAFCAQGRESPPTGIRVSYLPTFYPLAYSRRPFHQNGFLCLSTRHGAQPVDRDGLLRSGTVRTVSIGSGTYSPRSRPLPRSTVRSVRASPPIPSAARVAAYYCASTTSSSTQNTGLVRQRHNLDIAQATPRLRRHRSTGLSRFRATAFRTQFPSSRATRYRTPPTAFTLRDTS